MTEFTLENAKFLSIDQFKKLTFEITEKNYNFLVSKYNEKFDEKSSATKPFSKDNKTNKFLTKVTLLPWDKSNKRLRELNAKINPLKTCDVKCVIEFYNVDEKEGLILRFDAFKT